MSAAIIISLISVVVVCLSVMIAYIQYRDNHRGKVDDDLHGVIKEIASKSDEPLKEQIADHAARFTQMGDRLNRIEELLKSNSSDLRATTDTLTKMGVKVDLYWSTLEALAMNSAKNLHQPDPRRRPIDHLLEAFMEGTLTPEERTALKKMLVLIRNYEPGVTVLDFPVYPGEQTAASILLSTIDITDPARMGTYGHAAHRNHAVNPEGTTDIGEHSEL